MPNVSAQIELCRLTAARNVRQRRQIGLELLLLERSTLIALNKAIPISLIEEINELSGQVFGTDSIPPPPPVAGPLVEIRESKQRGPIADFFYRCFA